MNRLSMILASAMAIGSPALAQTAASAPAAAPAPAAPTVTAGATVIDTAGAPVGTIETVTGGTATLSTGTNKVGVPITSFAQGPNGLVLGMTKAQVDAAAAQAKVGATTEIAVGSKVSDAQGGAVGTVEAVAGDLVTVATPNAKAQLPKKAFAQGPNGLVIGMTGAQLDAAAKAAAVPKS